MSTKRPKNTYRLSHWSTGLPVDVPDVQAYTKGEARAMFKLCEMFKDNIDRLPKNLMVIEVAINR